MGSVNRAPADKDCDGDCNWMLYGGDDGNDVNKCACSCRSANPGCTDWNSKCAPCYDCQATGDCTWMNNCGDSCKDHKPYTVVSVVAPPQAMCTRRARLTTSIR